MKGPDARSRRLAIVITWDEDDDHSGNHVPLMVIHALPERQAKQVTTGSITTAYRPASPGWAALSPLRRADQSADVLGAFGLSVRSISTGVLVPCVRSSAASVRVVFYARSSRTLARPCSSSGSRNAGRSAAGSQTQCRQQHQNQGADGEDTV